LSSVVVAGNLVLSPSSEMIVDPAGTSLSVGGSATISGNLTFVNVGSNFQFRIPYGSHVGQFEKVTVEPKDPNCQFRLDVQYQSTGVLVNMDSPCYSNGAVVATPTALLLIVPFLSALTDRD